MALATEVMGGGLSSGAARAIGGINGTLAAAGTTQGNAAAVAASLLVVTGASGTNGVRLPAALIGDTVTIFNSSASSLLVYPETGAAIAVPGTGAGSANAAYTHTTFAVVEYKKVTATQWLPLKSA